MTGASGLIGSYLLRLINKIDFDYLYLVEHISNFIQEFGENVNLDLANPTEVRRGLDQLRPTTIVNLAALTDVDLCEANPVLAGLLNYRLPLELAEYSRRTNNGVYILHVSTDYVFDGNSGNYTEDSVRNPTNEYGKTKLLGEEAIQSISREQHWCVARISTPFGLHPKKLTFPIFVINKLLNRERFGALEDQFTSPSYAGNICDMLIELISNRAYGNYHIAGTSRLSRYEQALHIANMLGLDPSYIERSSSEQMNWIAKRPPDSSLCVNKARANLENKPLSFNAAMQKFIEEIKTDRYYSFRLGTI